MREPKLNEEGSRAVQLSKHLNHRDAPPERHERRYYSDDDLCEMFNVSKSMTRRWRETGLIEYLRAPGATTIRYTRDQIADLEKRLTQRAKGRRKE
jgi:DNA-binding transcriptional MerR regulator